MNAPGVDGQPTKTPGAGHEANEMFFSRVSKSTSSLRGHRDESRLRGQLYTL
jgi:hypothetical protein